MNNNKFNIESLWSACFLHKIISCVKLFQYRFSSPKFLWNCRCLPLFIAQATSSICWNGPYIRIHRLLSSSSTSSSSSTTTLGFLIFVITSVFGNVLSQPHRSYLKFYCKHMSILQQTILTHVHNIIGTFYFRLLSLVYREQMRPDMRKCSARCSKEKKDNAAHKKTASALSQILKLHIFLILFFACRNFFLFILFRHIKSYRRHNIFIKYLSHATYGYLYTILLLLLLFWSKCAKIRTSVKMNVAF